MTAELEDIGTFPARAEVRTQTTSTRCPLRAMNDKTQSEHNESALPPKADMRGACIDFALGHKRTHAAQRRSTRLVGADRQSHLIVGGPGKRTSAE
jgi:hypothetical protein